MPTYTTIICKFCNKSFDALPRYKNKQFCNNNCHQLFRSANKRVGLSNCINCNNTLLNAQYKFCSHSCSATFVNSNKSNDARKHPKKECITCKTITTNPKYCCKKCSGIDKIKYITEDEKLKAKRAKGREAYARYTAKKKYQTPVDEDLTAIKIFYKNCPAGHEVDHIIPISKGGHHSITNLQYLLKSDNRKKGAKLNWCPKGESNA